MQKVSRLAALSVVLVVLLLFTCKPTPITPTLHPENLTPTPTTSLGIRARIWRNGTLVGTPVKTTLPFEMRGDNHIFVWLNLNHSSTPQEYMLDTGSPVTLVSPETAAQVGLVPETRVGKFEVAFTPITVGEVEFADIGVMIGDVYTADLTNPLSCELKHGLIGQNLFRHAIWQFDYQQKIVTITSDLSNLAHIDKAQQVDLIETSQLVLGPHHFIEVLLGEVEMLGMIDTGRPTIEIGQAEFEAGGNRLPDRSEGRYIETTLKNLQVGDLSLIDFPVTVVRAGDLTIPRGQRTTWFYLGHSFLSHFVVTLDYPGQALYLFPYGDNRTRIISPAPVMYGFLPFYGEGDRLVVYRVVSPSVARRVGIKEGDRILRINSSDFSTTTHSQACALWLAGLDYQYNGPITVTVERAGQVYSFEIDKASPGQP